MEPVMKILALTVALLFAASPVAAQTSQTQQPLGAGGQRFVGYALSDKARPKAKQEAVYDELVRIALAN
jgi:hypothetical protein